MLTSKYKTKTSSISLMLIAIFICITSFVCKSGQNVISHSAKRTKHMLAIVSPDDPKSIEIVPEGINWLKSIREPISFVFQFKAGEENLADNVNFGLISEISNISDHELAGFRVERMYVNFALDSSDPMRTWKLYAIAALISSSYMIERGDYYKGAPKAMQIYNMLRQSILNGNEAIRTKSFDSSTLKSPSIFWLDSSELMKYLTSTIIDSMLNSKLAIDLPEYFDSKSEELDMLDVRSRIFKLAKPKELANEFMNGEQIADLIKYLVRYLNSERYPNQLELAFMTIYKRNYCLLEQDEKFLQKLSDLNEQLESPALTEFEAHSERVRKQIEKLMCPKFDPKVWCKSSEITV